MSDTLSHPDLLPLVVRIVSAHVAHNAVTPEALPELIRSVCAALNASATEAPAAEKPEPAVPIEKSVFPGHIICLEDGKKMKSLKRHLGASHGMTPAQYLERWGLPPGYPMVASRYAARRSAIAKESGLGRKPDAPEVRPPPRVQRIPEGVRGKKAARKAAGA